MTPEEWAKLAFEANRRAAREGNLERGSIPAILAENEQALVERSRGVIAGKTRYRLGSLDITQRERYMATFAETLGAGDLLKDRSNFLTVKSAQGYNAGFSVLALNRQLFLDQIASLKSGANKELVVENLATMLNLTSKSYQVFSADGTPSMSGGFRHQNILRGTAANMAQGIDKNATRLVFDLETTGLSDQADVRQIAAKLIGGDGEVLGQMNVSIHSKQLDAAGYEVGGSKFRSLNDFFKHQAANIEGARFTTDAEAALAEFLRLAKRADVLVGHNVGFDIDMLANAMSRYKGLRGAGGLDDFLQMVDDGKVMDTLLISQALDRKGARRGIRVAKHLQSADTFSMHSIENLLTKTNMLDLMADKVGYDEVRKWVMQGTHDAMVDIRITDEISRIYQEAIESGNWNIEYYANGRNIANRGRRGRYAWGDDVLKKLKESQAITPFTAFIEYGDGHKITPMQQLILQTRNMSGLDGRLDLNRVRGMVGVYDQLEKQALDKRGVLTGRGLGREEYEKIQRQAIKAGVSYAQLSSEERLITNLVGSQSSATDRLLGIGRIQATQYTGRISDGRIMALPGHILQQAIEEANSAIGLNLPGVDSSVQKRFADGITYGRLSAVDVVYENASRRGISLTLDVADKDQARSLINVFQRAIDDEGLRKRLHLGDDMKAVRDLASMDPEQLVKGGIQIGFFENEQLLNYLQFSGRGSDTQTISGLIRMAILGIGKDGTIEVGGAGIDAINKGVAAGRISDEDAIRMATSALTARETIESTGVVGGRTSDIIASWARGLNWTPETIEKAHVIAGPGSRNIKLGIGGILAFGTARLLYRKNQQEARQYETLEQQSYESYGDYVDYKAMLGEDAFTDRPVALSAPLETAGTVQQLHNNRSGHHRMGSDKYSYLFGV